MVTSEFSPEGVAAEGGALEKGMNWKISEKKIAAWIVVSIGLKYAPSSEEEAKSLMDRKRIKFRQIENGDGYALATLVNGKGKVIAQTSILNFIEYEQEVLPELLNEGK